MSGLFNNPAPNITNIHVERQADKHYLVWQQANASKIKITQEAPVVSLDAIIFAHAGQNQVEINYKTHVFDTYDNGLYGPFYKYTVYLPRIQI